MLIFRGYIYLQRGAGGVDDLLDRDVLDSFLHALLRHVLGVGVVVDLRNVLRLVLDGVVVSDNLLLRDVLGVHDWLVLDNAPLERDVLESTLSEQGLHRGVMDDLARQVD